MLRELVSRKAHLMSEQADPRLAWPPRPSSDDREVWQAYWQQIGQPWRTEPEIDTRHQKQLATSRSTVSNIEQGIYPFKGMQLSRADVEWLLATHENGRGPVDWSDEHQHERTGVDLRGADLCGVNLSHLPLACMHGGLGWKEWPSRTQEERDIAAALLEKANLSGTHLEGAELNWAQLKGADLSEAHLEEANLQGCHLEEARLYRAQLRGAHLFKAQLRGADLSWAHLEEVDLDWAHLEGTYLKGASLEGADLEQVTVGDEKHVGPRLVDTNWGNVNLAVVEWSQIHLLGDEHEARQRTRDGKVKGSAERLSEYQVAVRANRQLAIVLQGQGLNEDAARFAYRAQVLQRSILWWQRKLGAYIFSWILASLTGYGYKPERTLYWYVSVAGLFAVAYYLLGTLSGSHPAWYDALIVSLRNFHGRGFFSEQSTPGDPYTVLAAVEAFLGLFIEAGLIAAFAQRFFGR
jgi:uncharacterized protein YjbI with pentapeptide repeats